MLPNRIRTYLFRLLAAGLIVAALFASPHKGVVKSGPLPIPGATVTATQGDKKLVTTTDANGAYSFSELADGVWTVTVDMLGFAKSSKDIGVAPDAPSPEWDLKLLSTADLKAALEAKPAPPVAPAAGADVTGAQTAQAVQPATQPAPGPAATQPAPAQQANPPATTAAAQRPAQGRGTAAQAGGRNQGTAPGGRGAQASAGRGARGSAQASSQQDFQEVGVNQSADLSTFSGEGAISSEQGAELAQSANESLLLNGSMSSAASLGGMADFGGFGGRGMGGDMMGGGRGGDFGGGLNLGGGDSAGGGLNLGGGDMAGGGGAGAGAGAGGRGGAGGGGFAGGAGGGRGGGGGGFGGGAGGGGRGGGGAAGGRGGAAGATGRGGAGGRGGYMGMNNAMAFGNNRRNPRMMYTGNLSVNERNSLLNAQTYSISGAAVPKPYSNNTSVNATLGGPLKIPKLLSGNRGQITLGVGVTRGRQGNAGTLTTMPTDLEKTGDFSQSLIPVTKNGVTTYSPVVIYDPTNNTPFPNDRIPHINPIAQSLLPYFPHPNLTTIAGATRNYQLPYTNLNNSTSVNTRINQTLNGKNRVSGGFSYQSANTTSPNRYGFIDPSSHSLITDTGSSDGLSANASYSHNFTSRIIGTLSYSFSRSNNQNLPYFAALGQNIGGNLGILGLSNDPQNWGPPSLNFSNYAGFSDQTYTKSLSQTSSVTASLLWVHKTHNLSFGAGFRRQQSDTYSNPQGRGSFTFNGDATSLNQGGAFQPGTGSDFADFLLATPYNASIKYTANPSLYFRGAVWNLYVQDDWRMTPRLSVNWGLRWDYQTPVYELHNQLVNLAFAPAFSAFTTVQPGQLNAATGQPYSKTLINSDPNNISPRLGIAWRPSTKRNSPVIRAGAGIYYNTSVYSQVASNFAQQPPLVTAYNLYFTDYAPSTAPGMANAFVYAKPTSGNTVANTFAIDPNYKIGYAEQWQFAIQQTLPYSFQTTLTYNGTAGHDLDRQMRPWVVPPGAAQSPYPTGYTFETFGGNSIYNSGSVQLTRRFRGGLSANAIYTFQKGIQDASTAQNWLDYRADRAVFVPPQSLRINFSYGSGQGRRGGGLVSGWKGVLIKDWNLQSTITVGNSNFLTATVGGNQATKGGSNRANATGLPLVATTPGALFNLAAFAAPAAGAWGNAGRSIIPGPISFSLGASANRTFRLGDRQRMTFSLQATNALNTVVITGWGTTLNTNTFGQPTNVSQMRSVSTSLRVNF